MAASILHLWSLQTLKYWDDTTPPQCTNKFRRSVSSTKVGQLRKFLLNGVPNFASSHLNCSVWLLRSTVSTSFSIRYSLAAEISVKAISSENLSILSEESKISGLT